MSDTEPHEWYYVSANGERLGPVPIGELSALAGTGLVQPVTLVWRQGFGNWVPAVEISDLLVAARAVVAPMPGPSALPEAELAPDALAPELALPQEMKPRQGSFVFPRIIMGVIASGVLGAMASGLLMALEKSTWPGLAVFAGGSILSAFASMVAYRKERYQIHHTRLVCHRGGLVNDQTTELEIRNITLVKLRLPWLRFKFFGVGDVIVQTAGNAQPVVMRAIPGPEAVYAGLRARMRRNGFDLAQQQLLHEEQPAFIGIVGECFGLFVGGLVAGFLVLSNIPNILEKANSPAMAGLLPALLGFAGIVLLILIFLRFLDFRRRTYRVYNDVVVYEEGFLTRHNAFIPYENIADANTRCSFFDRIFGLQDVQVSCQGSGAEIKFPHLKNGVALSEAIDQLVVRARRKQKPAANTVQGDRAMAPQNFSRRTEPGAMPFENPVVAELKMDAGRTIVPLLLLFPLFPIWIAAMIHAAIRLMSTRYSVRPGSMRHSYRFLTVHEREFAYDKITGVVIKQNLWDRMFGTMTLRFWSIGSGQPMEFAHVHGRFFDLPALLRQAGIPSGSTNPYEAKADFGLWVWLRAGFKFLPLLLVFTAGTVFAAARIDGAFLGLLALPVLAGLIAFIHGKIYVARQRLRFHADHIEAEQGIISRRRYFTRYSNVKRNRVTSYPGGGQGELEIFVAGEEGNQQAGQQAKGQQMNLRPCSFTTRFLPAVNGHGLLLDDILCGRVEPTPTAVAAPPPGLLLEARRSTGSALFKLIMLSILVFPMILLLPLTVPLTVLQVKRWRYRVEASRIVMTWGLFYRSATSILLDRVDSIQQSQGPVNKLFKNGNVSIMTAGSSRPDLNIVDSPAYLEMYEIIKQRSR